MVGGGNVMAEVNLGIDLTRMRVTEELVDPERNALREQQSSDTSSELTARGIPGATANQAPTPGRGLQLSRGTRELRVALPIVLQAR